MKRIYTNMKTLITLLAVVTVFTRCAEEKPELPTQAGIFFSVVDKQVAFTALTINADSFLWDFGDGETSTEENPVHVYADGGYYTATLNVTGKTGNAGDEVKLAVAVTPYILMTGGPTAADGKTWKLTASHGSTDRFAYADADLSEYLALPQGAFDLYLGLGEVYQDTYTFHFDGKYSHDVKSDNAAFAAIAHQLATNGGANIVSTGSAGADYGLCTAGYTPEAGATFTYTENDDLTIGSVFGAGYAVTYNDVTTISFSGTEFMGFLDVNRTVIVEEIKDKSMRIVMFVSAIPDYYPLATNALVATLEVVE